MWENRPINSWGGYPCARLHSENIQGPTVEPQRFRVNSTVAGANSSVDCVYHLALSSVMGKRPFLFRRPADECYIYFTSHLQPRLHVCMKPGRVQPTLKT